MSFEQFHHNQYTLQYAYMLYNRIDTIVCTIWSSYFSRRPKWISIQFLIHCVWWSGSAGERFSIRFYFTFEHFYSVTSQRLQNKFSQSFGCYFFPSFLLENDIVSRALHTHMWKVSIGVQRREHCASCMKRTLMMIEKRAISFRPCLVYIIIFFSFLSVHFSSSSSSSSSLSSLLFSWSGWMCECGRVCMKHLLVRCNDTKRPIQY